MQHCCYDCLLFSLCSLALSRLTISHSWLRAAYYPNSFSQSECHKQYSAQKARKVIAKLGPQAKAKQRSERLVDSEQNVQNKSRHPPTLMKRYQQQSNEASSFHSKVGISLKSPCIPPINTVQHGGQIESLWGCNYVWSGLTAKCGTFYF